MITYSVDLCGTACVDGDYVEQGQWSTAFTVGTAYVPYDVYGVRGFNARTSIVGDAAVICDTYAYCWGPENEGDAPVSEPGIYPFRWKASLENGVVFYGRSSGYLSRASTVLFPETSISGALSVSISFDGNGLPYFAVAFDDGHIEVRRYTNTDKSTASTVSFTGNDPQLFFVGLLQEDSSYWDVVCYYTKTGVLYERIQRDDFGIEHEVLSIGTSWDLKHTDRGSLALSNFHLLEIHNEAGSKEMLSVEYGAPTPSDSIVTVSQAEGISGTVSVASDMAYAAFTPPVSISGGTATDAISGTVEVAADMAYELSLPVSPVSVTDALEATVSVASDMAYDTLSRSASGSDSIRYQVSAASDMVYVDPSVPAALWKTTPPTGLTTEAQKAKPCIIMWRDRAEKLYTYSFSGDGGAGSMLYSRADAIPSGVTWAYVSETWDEVGSSAQWSTTPPTITDKYHQQNKTFTNWTFDGGTKKLTFTSKVANTDFDATHPEDLLSVYNKTKKKTLFYNPGAQSSTAPTYSPLAGLGGTWSGLELTLQISMSGNYDAGDELIVGGNILWDVSQSASVPSSSSMPTSWIRPVVIGSGSYATVSLPNASFTYRILEARTTQEAWYVPSGLPWMYLDTFADEVSLP